MFLNTLLPPPLFNQWWNERVREIFFTTAYFMLKLALFWFEKLKSPIHITEIFSGIAWGVLLSILVYCIGVLYETLTLYGIVTLLLWRVGRNHIFLRALAMVGTAIAVQYFIFGNHFYETTTINFPACYPIIFINAYFITQYKLRDIQP